MSGAYQQTELVLLHQGVVAEVELEPGLLLEAAQEDRLLLQEVQGNLGVCSNEELPLFRVHAEAPDRPLDAPRHG